MSSSIRQSPPKLQAPFAVSKSCGIWDTELGMLSAPAASTFLNGMLLLYSAKVVPIPTALDELMVQSQPSTAHILWISPQLGMRQTLLCGTCAFALFPTVSGQAWSALLSGLQGVKDLGDEVKARQLPFLQAASASPIQPKGVQRRMSMQPA